MRATKTAPGSDLMFEKWFMARAGYNVTDLRSDKGMLEAQTNRTTQRAEGGMDERHQMSFSPVS